MPAPVDLTNLRSMIDNDRELEKELFNEFYQSFETEYKAMAANTKSGAHAAWRSHAHALKGISVNLGAEKLGDLCKQAQESFEADEMTKAKLAHDIHEAYQEVRAYLATQ